MYERRTLIINIAQHFTLIVLPWNENIELILSKETVQLNNCYKISLVLKYAKGFR